MTRAVTGLDAVLVYFTPMESGALLTDVDLNRVVGAAGGKSARRIKIIA